MSPSKTCSFPVRVHHIVFLLLWAGQIYTKPILPSLNTRNPPGTLSGDIDVTPDLLGPSAHLADRDLPQMISGHFELNTDPHGFLAKRNPPGTVIGGEIDVTPDLHDTVVNTPRRDPLGIPSVGLEITVDNQARPARPEPLGTPPGLLYRDVTYVEKRKGPRTLSSDLKSQTAPSGIVARLDVRDPPGTLSGGLEFNSELKGAIADIARRDPPGTVSGDLDLSKDKHGG